MVEFNFLSKLPRDSLRRQFTFNHLIKQAYQKLIFFWINFPIKADSFLNKRHHISLVSAREEGQSGFLAKKEQNVKK